MANMPTLSVYDIYDHGFHTHARDGKVGIPNRCRCQGRRHKFWITNGHDKGSPMQTACALLLPYSSALRGPPLPTLVSSSTSTWSATLFFFCLRSTAFYYFFGTLYKGTVDLVHGHRSRTTFYPSQMMQTILVLRRFLYLLSHLLLWVLSSPGAFADVVVLKVGRARVTRVLSDSGCTLQTRAADTATIRVHMADAYH